MSWLQWLPGPIVAAAIGVWSWWWNRDRDRRSEQRIEDRQSAFFKAKLHPDEMVRGALWDVTNVGESNALDIAVVFPFDPMHIFTPFGKQKDHVMPGDSFIVSVGLADWRDRIGGEASRVTVTWTSMSGVSRQQSVELPSF